MRLCGGTGLSVVSCERSRANAGLSRGPSRPLLEGSRPYTARPTSTPFKTIADERSRTRLLAAMVKGTGPALLSAARKAANWFFIPRASGRASTRICV